MGNLLLLIFQLIVLIFSVIIHEVSHGLMAYRLGDNTAKDEGRLNLNPINHLDFFGSFVLPFSLYFLSGGSFVLGWAKPVPYNPMNLRNPKSGGGLIALAGPASNLILAIIASILLRIGILSSFINPVFLQIIIVINISLMIFNLVPIPPLDGSKILFSLLPNKLSHWQYSLERYGWWLIIAFVLFGFSFIMPVINWMINILV